MFESTSVLTNEVMSDNTIEASSRDDSSIDNIEREIKSWARRKFELETELHTSRPLKFGNLVDRLQISCPPKNINYREESQRLNLKNKLHFYELCGIYVKMEEDETKVCFRSVHNSKKYSVWIKKDDDQIGVTRHFLPPIVPLNELIENYLRNGNNIRGFFRKIFHYIVVFENRISQINDFKCSEEIKYIDLFYSHSIHYVSLKINFEGESSTKLNVHLKYLPDFIYPQNFLLDGGGLKKEEKQALMEKCQAFKRMPLLEAVREAFS